ncbi:OmpA family protein [Campylobacter sp. CCS1377]|uniref:OmpA family protein n=1 Tax=Campylobacter sp. CCS1377 TaxID=3158229 RepID=A0AAU7EBE7_9BACT|nr:OmpA family protein [Campylobacter jejuni]
MQNKENNFWILYANLMGALFFIFILIIAAIVIKYALTKDKLEGTKNALSQQEQTLEQKKQDFEKQEQIIYTLAKRLADVNSSYEKLNVKDQDLLILVGLLEKREEEYEKLKEKFTEFRQRLNNVNYSKQELSAELKKNPNLNPIINEEANIILDSDILFNTDSYILKSEIKENLRKQLTLYFDSVLNNKIFAPKIENIIIESHTNSDGSYMYNLDLSQKRAHELLNFILSFYKDTRLQKLLIATGKSYSEPIFKNGKEDKISSRRMEIKIQISNKAIVQDIEKLIFN